MTWAQWLAAGVGVIVLAWPYIPEAIRWVFLALAEGPAPKPLDEVVAPTYRDSIYYLAQVRLRLSATAALGDDQKRAIDILTLALVDGSDK